ncbi:hypothetical protein LZ30DRAFT_85002 [Colletotrichum cereale]|nr:hypothetical protein LZ30DRAFT_85002 [Colletotrichum cereale]
MVKKRRVARVRKDGTRRRASRVNVQSRKPQGWPPWCPVYEGHTCCRNNGTTTSCASLLGGCRRAKSQVVMPWSQNVPLSRERARPSQAGAALSPGMRGSIIEPVEPLCTTWAEGRGREDGQRGVEGRVRGRRIRKSLFLPVGIPRRELRQRSGSGSMFWRGGITLSEERSHAGESPYPTAGQGVIQSKDTGRSAPGEGGRVHR